MTNIVAWLKKDFLQNYKFHFWFLIVFVFTMVLLRSLARPPTVTLRAGIFGFSIFIPIYFVTIVYLFFRASKTSISSGRFLLALILVIFNYITVFAFFFRAAGLYTTHCLPSDNTCASNVIHEGSASLYFSAITLTTVGYGDFIPANNFGRLLASMEALSGYFVLATIVAIVSRRLHGSRS